VAAAAHLEGLDDLPAPLGEGRHRSLATLAATGALLAPTGLAAVLVVGIASASTSGTTGTGTTGTGTASTTSTAEEALQGLPALGQHLPGMLLEQLVGGAAGPHRRHRLQHLAAFDRLLDRMVDQDHGGLVPSAERPRPSAPLARRAGAGLRVLVLAPGALSG